MNRTDKAVSAMRCGNEYIWLVCLIAGRAVGKRDGQTQELAQALLKSVSQVENYSHAYFGYKLSRKYIRARDRAALSPGHFATLWTCWRRIEFDPELCGYYIESATLENMNAEQLREYIENDNNVQPKPVTLGESWFQRGWDWTETIADLEIRLKAQQLFRDFRQTVKGLL